MPADPAGGLAPLDALRERGHDLNRRREAVRALAAEYRALSDDYARFASILEADDERLGREREALREEFVARRAALLTLDGAAPADGGA